MPDAPDTFSCLIFLKGLSLYLPDIGLLEAPAAFAASVVVLLPAFFIFLGGQDYLEQGIVAAAVKE